jgi:hypothetical protein
VYVGTHARFKVGADGWQFEVVTEAASVERFRDGQTVPLALPRDKIWLVPSEE